MFNSDKERSSVSGGDCGGRGGGGNDDDDDDDHVGVRVRNQNQKRRWGQRYKRNLRRAKQVVLFPFRKTMKPQLHPPTGNNSSSCSGSGSFATAANGSGRGKRMIRCCLCLKPPQTLESPLDSRTSDPNNPDVFHCESLKSLIENNDFYSKECNPHIDIFLPLSE